MLRDLYLGTLYSTEHQKVFGYVTNTRVKFIIIVDNSNTNLRYGFYKNMTRYLAGFLFYIPPLIFLIIVTLLSQNFCIVNLGIKH